jgi:hypothetical protein
MPLLIASLSTVLISIAAVFHVTDSLLLRIAGTFLGLASGGSVFTFAQTNKNLERSVLGLLIMTVLGIFVCWPVFDLFRDLMGLDSFWSVSKFHQLGRLGYAWLFAGIVFLPIMVDAAGTLLGRLRKSRQSHQ